MSKSKRGLGFQYMTIPRKQRKVTFADSSKQPAIRAENLYDGDVVVQVPLNNSAASPLQRLQWSRNPHQARPIHIKQVATALAPQGNIRKGPGVRLKADPEIRQYALTSYQNKLQYAEGVNMFLADFDSSRYNSTGTGQCC
jgi:hypothetical protein